MQITKVFLASAILVLLMAGAQVSAQTELTNQSITNVEIRLYYSPLELAFETWDDTTAPDTVKWDAYRVASGYLAGIAFHYEKNRDRLSVFEQIDEVAEDIVYTGYESDVDGYYSFNYDLPVPYGTYMAAREAAQVNGHGVSEQEDRSAGRSEARSAAFEEAVMAGIREHYSGPNQVIPGVVDGWISWYEITRDEVDPESGSYVFDITAWIKFNGE